MRRVPASLRTSVALLWLGCASSAGPKLRAENTVRVAARALTDVEATSGGEATPDAVAALEAALGESRDWLAPAESAIEMWSEGGDVAYERAAACLGAALGRVRTALGQAGREAPQSLEQAESQAVAASSTACGETPAE